MFGIWIFWLNYVTNAFSGIFRQLNIVYCFSTRYLRIVITFITTRRWHWIRPSISIPLQKHRIFHSLSSNLWIYFVNNDNNCLKTDAKKFQFVLNNVFHVIRHIIQFLLTFCEFHRKKVFVIKLNENHFYVNIIFCYSF